MSTLRTYPSLIKELREVISRDECAFVIRLTSNDKQSSCFFQQISMYICGLAQRCNSIFIEHIHPSCENGEEKRTYNEKKNEPSADNSIRVLRNGPTSRKIADNVTIHDLNVTHTSDSSETNNEKVEYRPVLSLKAETPKLNNRSQSKKENVTRSNHSSRVDNTSVPVCAKTCNRLREASEELHSTAVTGTQNFENNGYKLHENSHSETHSQPSRVLGDNVGTPRQIHSSNKSSCASSSVLSSEKLMCKGNDLENSSCAQQTVDHVDSNKIIATTVLKESEVTDDITDIGSSTTKPEETTLLKLNNSSIGKLPHLEKNLQPFVLVPKTLATNSEQLDVMKSINNVTSRKCETVTEPGSNNKIYEGHVNNSSVSNRSRVLHYDEICQSPCASRITRGSVSQLNLSKVSIRDDLENACNDQPAVSVTSGHTPPAKIKASHEVKDSREKTLPRMDKSFQQPVTETNEGEHIPRNINLETSSKADDFVSVSHSASHNVVHTSYRSLRNKNRNTSTLNTTYLVEESQIMESSLSQMDVEMSLNRNEDRNPTNDSFKLPQNIGSVTVRKVRRTSTISNTSILNESVPNSIQECGSVGRIKIFTLKHEPDNSISSQKRPMFAFPYSPRRKIRKLLSNSKNYNMSCLTDVDTSVENVSKINTTFTSSKKDAVKNHHTYIKNVNESTKNLESISSKEKGETSFRNCQTSQTEHGKKSDKDPKDQIDASFGCKSVGRFKIFTSTEDQNSSISSKNRPMFAVPFSPRNNRPNSDSKIGSDRCFTDIETSKENNVSKINSTFSRVSIPHTSSNKSPVKNHQAHIKNVTESSKNLDCKNMRDKKETFPKNCEKNQTENCKEYDEDTRVLRHSSKTNYSNNDDNNNDNSSSTLDARKKSDSGFSSLRFIKKCSKKPQKDKDSSESKAQEYKKRGNSLNVGNGHSSSISTIDLTMDDSDEEPLVNIRSKLCKSFGDFSQTEKNLLSEKKTPTPALDRSRLNEREEDHDSNFYWADSHQVHSSSALNKDIPSPSESGILDLANAIEQVVHGFKKDSRVPKVMLTNILMNKTELKNDDEEIETEVNARSEDKPSPEKSKTDFASNDGEDDSISDSSKEISMSSPSEVNENTYNLRKRKKESDNVVDKGEFYMPSTGIKYRYVFKTKNSGFSAYSEISDNDSSFAF